MVTHVRDYRTYKLAPGFMAVAAINLFDDELFDWAVYVGGGSDPVQVAMNGEKVLPNVATAMFPDLPIDHYRT